jgi:AraC-like DNA-binding protein
MHNPGTDHAAALLANHRLRRVFTSITKDLSKRMTLTQAARTAGLEPTYFCKYFQSAVGMTFLDWDRKLRIERAKAMLENGDLYITTVALAVGYADVTTFERNFRRCLGLSPRRYRNQHKGTARTPTRLSF